MAPAVVAAALDRHFSGDWGDVPDADRDQNDAAVRECGMILSVHYTPEGVKFWIITDAGHETTTVLIPDDY